MNRKTFLSHTAMVTAGLLFEPFAESMGTPAHAGFQLKIMATDWGFPGTLDEYGAKVRAAGYDGIEIWWSLDPERQKAIFDMLAKYQLEVGFLCAGSQSDPKEHF